MSGSLRSRIGVFGGTFDPPHEGHLAAAARALKSLNLEVVLMVVANDPWQKTTSFGPSLKRSITPAAQRLAMVAAAVDDVDGVEVEDLEIRRGGPTYTADTLAELEERYPDAELILLVGADAAAGMDTWVRSEDVQDRATIVVMVRPGDMEILVPSGWSYEVLEVPAYDISSTEVRQRLRRDEAIETLVSTSVLSTIEAFGLYREGE